VAAERTTVDIVAGINSSGDPVFEEVLVDRLDSGTYRVVATPGLGGSLDGRADNLTVYTIPVSAGFTQVERVFNDLLSRHTDVEWYFGNVYDADGVTPLNWWQ
jgi:hypothetical protein